MGRLEMLLPFCSEPNRPIMDVVEKLHGDIYVLLMPNASLQLLPEAEAERTLEAVRCKAMIMYEASPSADLSGMLTLGNLGKQGRRRPHAILHPSTPILLRHRLACPKHGRLYLESRW
jgi:hypothetical protein